MGLQETIAIRTGGVELPADLTIPDQPRPDEPRGVVVFAHGSGSGRHSPRNQEVAGILQAEGHVTLLLDLLTDAEDERDPRMRFDIGLLADRLVAARRHLADDERLRGLPAGYFGASTGAGAALVATARQPGSISAVVSRGGRPDLAGHALPEVDAPTLLVVGGADEQVIELNRLAMRQLTAPHVLEIVPGATHLFSEPGALEHVSRLAAEWFTTYFESARRGSPSAPEAEEKL